LPTAKSFGSLKILWVETKVERQVWYLINARCDQARFAEGRVNFTFLSGFFAEAHNQSKPLWLQMRPLPRRGGGQPTRALGAADQYQVIPLFAQTQTNISTGEIVARSQDALFIDQTNGHMAYCTGSLNILTLSLALVCNAQRAWASSGTALLSFPTGRDVLSGPVQSGSQGPGIWNIDDNGNLSLCVKSEVGGLPGAWYCSGPVSMPPPKN
jgi:hypothetical protein